MAKRLSIKMISPADIAATGVIQFMFGENDPNPERLDLTKIPGMEGFKDLPEIAKLSIAYGLRKIGQDSYSAVGQDLTEARKRLIARYEPIKTGLFAAVGGGERDTTTADSKLVAALVAAYKGKKTPDAVTKFVANMGKEEKAKVRKIPDVAAALLSIAAEAAAKKAAKVETDLPDFGDDDETDPAPVPRHDSS